MAFSRNNALMNVKKFRHQMKKSMRSTKRERRPLTYEQRVESKEATESLKAALQADLNAEWERQDMVAQQLALKHEKNLLWMKTRLQRLPKYANTKRKVSKWNAYNHVKALEIGDDLSPEEKLELQQLKAIANSTTDWRLIPDNTLDAMVIWVEKSRLRQRQGMQACRLARGQDISNTGGHVADELRNLDLRCITSSFFINVRSKPEQNNSPRYYFSPAAEGFMEMVLGMGAEEFCLKFEAYAVCGLKGVVKNDNERRSKYKSFIRTKIRDGLRKITGNEKIEMSWEQYEDKIVFEHGVVLEGWPASPFNPTQLSAKALETIIEALNTGACCWKKLDQGELEARRRERTAKIVNGDIQLKVRKQRSDAGKKRGKGKSVGGGIIPDGGESSEDNGEEGGIGEDEEMSSRSAKRRRL